MCHVRAVKSSSCGALLPTKGDLLQPGSEVHDFRYRHARRKGGELWKPTHRPEVGPSVFPAQDVETVVLDPAARGLMNTGKAFEQRCLAGAVRSQKSIDPGRYVKRDASEHVPLAIPQREVISDDGGRPQCLSVQ